MNEEFKGSSFDKSELAQIEELKKVMSNAKDVSNWNKIREENKVLWPMKIRMAIDGLRKWKISYDKQTKSCTLLGVNFNKT